ncbi:uncharacterized protein LOC133174732 [Saccostrea echinata]|uniref:uncharacterized protein LOC133174732 n=1 Tax=Saccostrea echinata TaxID=191078 RepID=UPI002A837F01|nr:uncharacterized protein LOC133174732 [Saccostrea echinata]
MMGKWWIITFLCVQYVSAQTSDPTGGLDLDSLLAEINGFAPGRQGTSGKSTPGNLGSAVADIPRQAGTGVLDHVDLERAIPGTGTGALDLEAAINDITKELQQNLAANPGLQGLVAGGNGDFSNIDALLNSFGGETGTSGVNTIEGIAKDASPAFGSSDLFGSAGGNIASIPSFPSKSSGAESNSGGRQSTSTKSATETSESNIQQNVPELSLPNLNDLSFDPSPVTPKKEITKPPRDPFTTQTVNQQQILSQTMETLPSTQTQDTDFSRFSNAAFARNVPPVATQLQELNRENTNLFSLPETRGTGQIPFGQSIQPNIAQLRDLRSRFTSSGTSRQRPPSSPSTKLEDLSAAELRRALSEVNKEIDRLSVPLKSNRHTSGTENAIVPDVNEQAAIINPGRGSSTSSVRFQPNFNSGRLPGTTGFESTPPLDSSLANAFELPQLENLSSGPTSGIVGAGASPSLQSRGSGGPESEQFVTAARPQIDPLSALQNVGGGGIPFGAPSFGFSPNIGNQFLGLPTVGVPPRGGVLPGQIAPNLLQNQVLPGFGQPIQQPDFINTNRLNFERGSISGENRDLRSSLPNLIFETPSNGSPNRDRFEPPNRRSPERNGFNENNRSNDNRGEIIRGGRQENVRNRPRDSIGNRSPDRGIRVNRPQDRNVNSILSSISRQRSRDSNLIRRTSNNRRRVPFPGNSDRRSEIRQSGRIIRQRRPPVLERGRFFSDRHISFSRPRESRSRRFRHFRPRFLL